MDGGELALHLRYRHVLGGHCAPTKRAGLRYFRPGLSVGGTAGRKDGRVRPRRATISSSVQPDSTYRETVSSIVRRRVELRDGRLD
jgi:hypothetical protein